MQQYQWQPSLARCLACSDRSHLQVWGSSINCTVHVGRQQPCNIIQCSNYQAQHGIDVWLQQLEVGLQPPGEEWYYCIQW
jgi:hypothetical protein